MNVPLLSLRDASIAYGSTVVVPKLSLDIAPGELVVLLGPSGCGKSTLLSAIAGLTDLHDGQIFIRDRDVTWVEPGDRGIGMVFQSYALYPRMTVEQNLSFGLRVAGTDKATIRAKVTEAARVLQLEPLLQRRPAELSGGQRQRVAIGRALVRDVDIFLFDEPLSNLDAKLRNDLRIEIRRLHEELRRTMVYVTHDQVEAMTLADRIVVMKSGVIQQVGTPDEIYARPANLFVAQFVGNPSIALLDGQLDGSAFAFDDIQLDLAGYPFLKPAGGTVRLGLRPEMIRDIGADPVLQGMQSFSATVEMVEHLGPSSVIWCRSGGQRFAYTASGRVEVQPGSVRRLAFDPASCSIFDSATGQRL